MTFARFPYQRQCVQAALSLDHRPILNVGCNQDPGRLKELDPQRVQNCDLHAEISGEPNVADVLFDASAAPWPYEDASVALVVFGDVLEHLTEPEMRTALHEARRVSHRLCITVPEDERKEVGAPEHVDAHPRGAVHRTTVTAHMLACAVKEAGWSVTDWQLVQYDSGQHWGQLTMGYFIQAT